MLYLNVIFCVILLTSSVASEGNRLYDDKGPGRPLYLTKLIQEGKFERARKAATVKPLVGNVKSYSGYLTVDEKFGSNLLFWYFQSETDYENVPTVVWLQGGPGSSLYLGLFNENGPYIINKHQKIFKRKYTWSKFSNLIYFDNPVGTGYSFTESNLGYATNQTKVGKDLYEALIQLYKLFPYMQKNNLFISGESYGGKYAPALGYIIHNNNKNKPEIYLKLKGLTIGNGFLDPLHMLKYSDYLYQLGLIDDIVKRKFRKLEMKTSRLIKKHKWYKASQLIHKVMVNNSSLLYKSTGLQGYSNYVTPLAGDWLPYENEYIMTDNFRRLIHVGNNTLNDGSKVYKHLYSDIPKSVVNWVVKLLKHYQILFYNGQLDIVCAYPLTENILKHLKWPFSHKYKKAMRHIYKVHGEVAGYYKIVGNLTEALIRNAGHMAPANQPKWVYHLFNDFINDKFNNMF